MIVDSNSFCSIKNNLELKIYFYGIMDRNRNANKKNSQLRLTIAIILMTTLLIASGTVAEYIEISFEKKYFVERNTGGICGCSY